GIRRARRRWRPRRGLLVAAARRAAGGVVGHARRGCDMILERWTSEDPQDARYAGTASGLLRVFNDAGILTAADLHVARRTADMAGEDDDAVRLAVALAVRAVR